VTSGFVERPSPFTGLPELHPGVDLAAPFGTAILAAADGVVRFAGERGGHGLAVEIDHGAGEITLYGHASELLVAEGQTVRKGDVIARVGRTGLATGNHLHFEARIDRRPVNPAWTLKRYESRADGVGAGMSPTRQHR
jgi:murein DD-endopeptidase MepM/ murein hydrolase activator NlpD